MNNEGTVLIIIAASIIGGITRNMLFRQYGRNTAKFYIPFYRDWMFCKELFGFGPVAIAMYIPYIRFAARFVVACAYAKAFSLRKRFILIQFFSPFAADFIVSKMEQEYEPLESLKDASLVAISDSLSGLTLLKAKLDNKA